MICKNLGFCLICELNLSVCVFSGLFLGKQSYTDLIKTVTNGKSEVLVLSSFLSTIRLARSALLCDSPKP